MKSGPLLREREIEIEDWQTHSSLNFLIVYDRLDSAVRAKDTLDRLLDTFGDEFSFHFDFWRLDLLESSVFREQALEAGGRADVVLIAARDCAEISTRVKAWLFEWVAQRTGGTAALVGLFERCGAIHAFEKQVRSFLRPLGNHVDVLFFEGGLPEEERSSCRGGSNLISELQPWNESPMESGDDELTE